MANNDYDGTTSYEIGKLYDYDGTSSHQIGKVYDYDGTSSYLIYSAQTDLIVDGVVQSTLGGLTLRKQQYSSSLTYPTGYVLLTARNSGTVSRVDSTNKIDWTQFSVLKIELGASNLQYSQVLLAIGKNTSIPTSWWLEASPNANYSQKAFSWSKPVWTDGTILELNIAGCTEQGILMFGTKDNIGNLYIKNMWLE